MRFYQSGNRICQRPDIICNTDKHELSTTKTEIAQQIFLFFSFLFKSDNSTASIGECSRSLSLSVTAELTKQILDESSERGFERISSYEWYALCISSI